MARRGGGKGRGGKGNTWGSGDAFNRKAKDKGFAARSVFKLEELDKRFKLLRPGDRVLDLGACPGSWSQYALRRVGRGGLLVSVDLQPISVSLPGAVVLQEDVFALEPEALAEHTEGRAPPFDAVISDMAPATTGVPFRDHVASVELCDRALGLASRMLVPGGVFVCKVFQGEDEPELRNRIRARFSTLKSLKPKGTRSRSVEIFLVGLGYSGEPRD
ncbi:MAG: RlmE family RNA methyltransferase [Deltaproteobacteria bacterium]|nr:RlmE family RNA methyltransferase [Deltaproteobacteria bacterium]